MVNVTLPVGVPAPGVTAETAASKVTPCPVTGLAGTAFTAVVVLASSIVWDNPVEISEAAKFPSPRY
jgi:hypothetical protein